jgi:acyl carrier protein
VSGREPISFDDFRALVARELHIEEDRVTEKATFVEDLFADSIRLVELMFTLEKKGISIPMEEAWNVKTVGDAYKVYAAHVRREGGGDGAR